MTDTQFYSILVDRERALIHIKQFGFWTADTARSFSDAYRKTLNTLAPTSDGFVVLLDQQEIEVQSAEVAEILAMLAATTKPQPRKVAVLADKAIIRMQGKRINNNPSNQWFDNEADARAWL